MTDNQTWSKHCILYSYLTHLCRMYFPILINWMSPFPVLGLLGGIFHFHSNFKRNLCKQTVENLIRRRVLRRLIWFCTVCQSPTKRTLGLYGFNTYTCMSIFAYFYYTDIYIELLRGYHNLDTGLNIQHKGSGKLTIRAYNGHEVYVV